MGTLESACLSRARHDGHLRGSRQRGRLDPLHAPRLAGIGACRTAQPLGRYAHPPRPYRTGVKLYSTLLTAVVAARFLQLLTPIVECAPTAWRVEQRLFRHGTEFLRDPQKMYNDKPFLEVLLINKIPLDSNKSSPVLQSGCTHCISRHMHLLRAYLNCSGVVLTYVRNVRNCWA